MKNFLKLSIFLLLISFTFQTAFAQDYKKPEPIKSVLLDNMMGVWTAEPYEMMGSTWSDESNQHMMHNGQYLFIDINGKSSKGETYTATVVMVPNKDGSFTGWGFDDWGSITNYTGKTLSDNKITVTGTSSWGTETREITIDGDKMTHDITFTMKGQDGKDMTMKMTVNYNRKK